MTMVWEGPPNSKVDLKFKEIVAEIANLSLYATNLDYYRKIRAQRDQISSKELLTVIDGMDIEYAHFTDAELSDLVKRLEQRQKN